MADINLLQILFIILLIVLVAITAYVKDEHMISVLILSYFFFPNWATHLTGIYNIPLFTFLQVFQYGLVLFRCIHCIRSQALTTVQRKELFFLGLFILTIGLQLFLGTPYQIYRFASVTNGIPNLPAFFVNFTRDISMSIFFLACICYLKSLKQIEDILKLIVLCSCFLFAEFLFAVIAEIFGFALLAKFSLDSSGIFRSVFLNSNMATSLWSASALVSALYLATKGKNHIAVFCLRFIWIIPLYNYHRSIFLATFISLAYSLLACQQTRRVIHQTIPALLITLLTLIPLSNTPGYHFRQLLIQMHLIPQKTNNKMQQSYSLSSSKVRIGQALRGLQSLSVVFPFGFGPEMVRYYMPLALPRFLAEETFASPKMQTFKEGYLRVTYQGGITDIQIAPISFIVGYGLPGIMFFCYGLLALCSNINHIRLRHTAFSSSEQRYIHATFALITIYAIFSLFNTTPIIFVIFMPLLHFTFLSSASPEALLTNEVKHFEYS